MYGNNTNTFSDRRDYSSGGGGRGVYRSGGYRGGGRRGGGYRGGRRFPQHGNRFADHRAGPRKDPQQQVLQDLLQMVTKVGTLTAPPPPPPTGSHEQQQDNKEDPNHPKQQPPQRSAAVMQQIAQNVRLLTGVVCGSNRALFLRFDPTARTLATERFGPVAVHGVRCAACLPLQTPVYAALAVSLHEASRVVAVAGDSDSHANELFLPRTVAFCSQTLARDLDRLLLDSSGKNDSITHNNGTDDDQADEDLPAHTLTRCRLQLRYLALLQEMNVVASDTNTLVEADDDDNNTKHHSLNQLLLAMVQAAQKAVNSSHHNHPNTGYILTTLVLSTLPYLVSGSNSSNRFWVESHLLHPLEMLCQHYRSAFQPGTGAQAILLKEEQVEEGAAGEEEPEDEDEIEEDDDDAAGQVCDSLQDLLRSTKTHLQKASSSSDETAAASRWALWREGPWIAPMAAPTETEGDTMTDKDDDNNTSAAASGTPSTTTTTTTTTLPLKYTGEPLPLAVLASCQSLRALLSLGSAGDDDTTTTLSKSDLTGIVYGRLPIFGAPPDVELDDDDDELEDDDEEENMQEEGSSSKGTTTNERLQAYQKEFGLVDRYFIGEAVRDILLSHQPSVSETGVQRGNVKTVAEQVWSIRFMMVTTTTTTTSAANNNGNSNDQQPQAKSGADGDDPTKGIEYAILETILSLMVQCSPTGSAFSLVYLSRVVLELTKLAPTIISPAIVLAVSTLFQDYMPALTPAARHNLSQWFAFHLIHTDYQWPAGYWKHWEPYVVGQQPSGEGGWRSNSRGAFVQDALSVLVENVSDPEHLVTECLPKDSLLVNQLLMAEPQNKRTDPASALLKTLQADVQQRISVAKEDPDSLLQYLLSDEVTESTAAALADVSSPEVVKKWCMTGVVMRAFLAPAVVDLNRLQSDLAKAREASGDEDGMEEDSADREDVLSLFLDTLKEYKPVLLGIMEKEAESQGESSGALAGGIFLLQQLDGALFYSRTLFQSCIQAMLQDGLLSAEKILQWLLGDYLGEANDTTAVVVLRWWELAQASIRLGMMMCAAAAPDTATTTSNEMEGVEGEGTDAAEASKSSSKKIQLLLHFLDPLLSYIVTRAGSVLISIHDETKGNKLLPAEVDLVEGCKFVVTESEALFRSMLLQDKLLSSAKVSDAWTESAVAGPRLASLLDIGGSPAVETLRTSLERM